jgi:hypothetical protein
MIDLCKQVSMEMESGGVGGMSSSSKGPQPTFTNSAWQRRTRLERLLLAAIALLFVIVVIILAITITKVAKFPSIELLCITMIVKQTLTVKSNQIQIAYDQGCQMTMQILLGSLATVQCFLKVTSKSDYST